MLYSLDLLIADDVVEGEEKWLDGVLLHFNGLQPKIWLSTMIIPALHLPSDRLTLQQRSQFIYRNSVALVTIVNMKRYQEIFPTTEGVEVVGIVADAEVPVPIPKPST